MFDADELPRTREERDRQFGTEEACREFFFRKRWPRGFECPDCGAPGWPMSTRNVIQCQRCDKQTSLTAGTVLHGTRKPLKTWFKAALLMSSGANATGLQRALGLTYKVAWTWAHKLRSVMKLAPTIGQPEPSPTSHPIDVKRARFARGVRGGLELAFERPGPEGCGCTKLDARDWADPTDPHKPDWPIERPRRSESSFSYSVRTQLEQRYHGSVSEKHLDAYLTEFAFFWNRRFQRYSEAPLIFALMTAAPTHSYPQIIGRERDAPRRHRILFHDTHQVPVPSVRRPRPPELDTYDPAEDPDAEGEPEGTDWSKVTAPWDPDPGD